jgi:rRNA maturation endonuclease Nob1
MEGQKKKIGFGPAFILSILVSPLVAWFFVSNSAAINQVGCIHCGNTYNEVEFCGICGKNEAGEVLKKGEFIKK